MQIGVPDMDCQTVPIPKIQRVYQELSVILVINSVYTKVVPSSIYWSKIQLVAAVSAGPYTNLHLAPDR